MYNLYIHTPSVIDEYYIHYIEKLKLNIQRDTIYITKNKLIADITLYYIFSLDDLIDLDDTKIILLFFLFKPDTNECDIIIEKINNFSRVYCISIFNLDWCPLIKNKYPYIPIGNISKNIYKKDQIYINCPSNYYDNLNQILDRQNIKNCILQDNINSLTNISYIPNLLNGVINSTLLEYIDEGLIPLTSLENIEFGIYNDIILKFNNNIITDYYNIINTSFEKFNFKPLVKIINDIYKKNVKNSNYIFLPLIDIVENNIPIENKECISYNGESRNFNINNLNYVYTNNNQGIFLKKSIYLESIGLQQLDNYFNFPCTKFIMPNNKKNDNKLIITTNNYQERLNGIIPFHLWEFSNKTITYITKDNSIYKNTLLTYINSIEYIAYLATNLTNLSKFQYVNRIEIYYRQSVVNIDILSKIFNDKYLDIHKYDLDAFNVVDNVSSETCDIIYSMFLSKSENIFYFHPTVYFYTNPYDFFSQKRNTIFFEGIIENQIPKSYTKEYRNWYRKNIINDDQFYDIYLNYDYFIYSRQKNWYSLLITIGFLNDNVFVDSINIAELLKLGLLSNNGTYNLIRNNLTSYGTIYDDIFIGWSIFNCDTLKIGKIPLWCLSNKPTHYIENISTIDWYFENKLWSIVANLNKNIKEIVKDDPILNIISNIYNNSQILLTV